MGGIGWWSGWRSSKRGATPTFRRGRCVCRLAPGRRRHHRSRLARELTGRCPGVIAPSWSTRGVGVAVCGNRGLAGALERRRVPLRFFLEEPPGGKSLRPPRPEGCGIVHYNTADEVDRLLEERTGGALTG